MSIVKFPFYVLLVIVTISYSVIPDVLAVDYVEVLDNFQHKDNTAKLFGISGHISSDFANMTVTYPDESVVTSSVSVTDRGYFQSFVMLAPTDPAGLYGVMIHQFNDTVSSTLNTSFFLSDYDGMLEIHILRNSVLECKDSSKYCTVPGTSHIPKSFGVRFFNDDYENHQIRIGSDTSNLILPGGDSIVYPQTGVSEYNCIFHPWVNGKLHVSDVPLLVHVDEIVSVNTVITPSEFKEKSVTSKNNIPQNQYIIDASCSMCYVGKVTKIVDGDTIYVDKKSIRLALVNTPEKRQTGYAEATEFVKNSCPVGSDVLVNVDDLFPFDSRGVEFAQITCGDVNINESLMNLGLAEMYDAFCTQSEFMYETWTNNNCDKAQTITPDILEKDIKIPIINNTIPLNVTGNIEIVSEKDIGIIYIIVVAIIVLLCLGLLIYLKKNTSLQNTSFTNIEYLE